MSRIGKLARRPPGFGGGNNERRLIYHESYKRAVMNYIKAEFGLDNEDAEKFRAVYERLKVSLTMSSDYVGGEV